MPKLPRAKRDGKAEPSDPFDRLEEMLARWLKEPAPAPAAVDVLLRAERDLTVAPDRRSEVSLDRLELAARRALVHIIAALANDDASELGKLERAADAFLKDFKPSKKPRDEIARIRFGDPQRHTHTVAGKTFHFGQAGFSFSRSEAVKELGKLAEAHSLAMSRRAVGGLTNWIGTRWSSLGIGRARPSRPEVERHVEHELSRLERLGHLEDPWRIASAVLVAALRSAGLESFEGKPVRKQAEAWLRSAKPTVDHAPKRRKKKARSGPRKKTP